MQVKLRNNYSTGQQIKQNETQQRVDCNAAQCLRRDLRLSSASLREMSLAGSGMRTPQQSVGTGEAGVAADTQAVVRVFTHSWNQVGADADTGVHFMSSSNRGISMSRSYSALFLRSRHAVFPENPNVIRSYYYTVYFGIFLAHCSTVLSYLFIYTTMCTLSALLLLLCTSGQMLKGILLSQYLCSLQ